MAAEHDVFHHVRDSKMFEVPRFLGAEWHIPQPFGDYFVITKFMVLELLVFALAFAIFTGLARRMQSGEPIRGRFWNFWEVLLVYLRDELVRPLIGGGHDHGHSPNEHTNAPAHDHASAVAHPADKYLPYVWSIFIFILLNNLLGAIPFLGSPTGSVWVTGVLAACTLGYVIRVGTGQLGFGGFWKGLVPNLDVPGLLKYFIIPLMWVIEFVGFLIKHGVLAIRLFANIMAGHTVIAVMLGFIGIVGNSYLFYLVAPASVLGQVGIGLLELFVAFLQAYVFAFLATLFIGSAVHPH